MNAADRDRDRIEQRAAEWLGLREERPLTPEEASAFSEWLEADPRHEAAVKELAGAWRTFDLLASYPRPQNGAADPEFFRKRRAPLPWRVSVAAAAAVLFIAGAAYWSAGRSPQDGAHRIASAAKAPTDVVSRLSDGSEIEVRAGGRAEPVFSPEERRVRLLAGEAHFAVTKDPGRPFVVEAGGVLVRAVGTAFNVRFDGVELEVLVTEGVVKVSSREAPGAAELAVRQRARIPLGPALALRAIPEPVTRAEVSRTLAWQSGRLVFEATPLADVIERFQRHAEAQLVLREDHLAQLRISGQFNARNLDGFLELLRAGFGLTVERQEDTIVIRSGPRE